MKFLKEIDRVLTDEGLNYEFDRFTGTGNTYIVGSYQEVSVSPEEELQVVSFYLDCFTKETRFDLEQLKETIKRLFLDYTTVLTDGTGIAINYESAIPVNINAAEYKQLRIILNVKEWSEISI